MTDFTDADLRRLDQEFAEQGIPFHARPRRAAQKLLGGISIGAGKNHAQNAITSAYRRPVPETGTIWPGMGIGFAASVDQVRRITVAVTYGTAHTVAHQTLGFDSHEAWIDWCRRDPAIVARSWYAVADLYDFAYGVPRAAVAHADAHAKWDLARANLEDVANILSIGFSMSSVLQPICMAAELALKGALNCLGVTDEELKSRNFRHNHVALVKRLISELPHRDDELLLATASELPDYVGSRYKDVGMTRLQVVEIALGAQFLVASSVRRFIADDLAQKLEKDEWPGARTQYF